MEVGGSEGEAVVGSKESRTVFVSNLVFSVTEEQLKEKFSEVILYLFVFECYNHFFIQHLKNQN